NQVYAHKGEPEDFSWDGTLHGNGQGAPDGVYFYLATFKDYKGKKKKQSGSVTILR
ncbi:MAG: gliding motility-associated C-terminal domain-containing protein, partial [Bacteroidales bacterium]|nr:gliding motility-associated C-terminal domain-containing protein [Bacteroidales bacterium]